MAGYIINLSWPLEVASSTLPLPTSLRTHTDMSAMFDNVWIRDYNNAMLGVGVYKCFRVEVWPFVPVAKDLEDLLKPVGGHWSLNGTRHTTGGTPSFWSTANH